MTSCSGLQKYLNQQGFHIVGYGCTTCIGNSGDLDESVASAIAENGMSFISFLFVQLLVVLLSLFVSLKISLFHMKFFLALTSSL